MENVFMAVSMDLGNASSPWGGIHPNDKQDVGYRLALAGRAIAYSEPDIYYTGPIAVKIQVSKKTLPTAWAIDVVYEDVGAEGIEIRTRDGFEVCTIKLYSYHHGFTFSNISLSKPSRFCVKPANLRLPGPALKF